MLHNVLGHDLLFKLSNLPTLLLHESEQFGVLVRSDLEVGTRSSLLALASPGFLAGRVVDLEAFVLAMLVDNFRRFRERLAHLPRAEVAVSECVVEGRHGGLGVVLSERQLVLRVILQSRVRVRVDDAVTACFALDGALDDVPLAVDRGVVDNSELGLDSAGMPLVPATLHNDLPSNRRRLFGGGGV